MCVVINVPMCRLQFYSVCVCVCVIMCEGVCVPVSACAAKTRGRTDGVCVYGGGGGLLSERGSPGGAERGREGGFFRDTFAI